MPKIKESFKIKENSKNQRKFKSHQKCKKSLRSKKLQKKYNKMQKCWKSFRNHRRFKKRKYKKLPEMSKSSKMLNTTKNAKYHQKIKKITSTINWIGQKGPMQFISSLGHYFTTLPLGDEIGLVNKTIIKGVPDNCLNLWFTMNVLLWSVL